MERLLKKDEIIYERMSTKNKIKKMYMNKMAGGGALMTRKENVQIKTKQKSSSI